MTTSTKTQETLRRGAEKLCERCEGSTWVEDEQMVSRNCSSCLDSDNKPTGYQFSWLRRACDGYYLIAGEATVHPSDVCKCQGSGYILPPEAELAGALMEMLCKNRPVLHIYPPNSCNGMDGWQVDDSSRPKLPTLVDALTAAWAKAVGLEE